MEERDSIFFSYSWKDMPIAMRIYKDLVRSGLKVWRDQINGTYGFNFAEEIKDKIRECSGFLLLDSRSARSSKWVREECRIFQSIDKRKNKKLSICIIEQESLVFNEEYPELLENQNTIKNFNFSKVKMYDNENDYSNEMIRLCKFWGVSYHPLSELGELKDFEDEISLGNISNDQREIILEQFRLNINRVHLSHPHVLGYIESLIKECDDYGINSASLYLMHGLYQVNKGDYLKAILSFEKSTRFFPFDSRGYRGLGGSYFKIGNYADASRAFSDAIKLISALHNNDTTVIPEQELIKYSKKLHIEKLEITILNFAASLFRLEHFEASLSEYQKVYDLMGDFKPPEIYIGLSDCLEALEDHYEQENILLEGLFYYPRNIRIHTELAQLYFRLSIMDSSLRHYQFIIDQEIQDIQIQAEYLYVLKLLDDRRFDNLSHHYIFHQSFATPDDLYYKGFIYYLRGEYREAKKALKKSKSKLPPYRDIY